MKKMLLFLILGLLLVSVVSAEVSTKANPNQEEQRLALSAQEVLVDDVDHCYQADGRYALYHNGLWWAWIAPVADDDWGVIPGPELIGDGWRWVADESEWALRPEASAFQSLNLCAATYFFPPAAHCDWSDPYYIDSSHPNGYLTYYLDNSVAELWVVHDDCGVPQNDVPEFGLIGAGALIVGAVIFVSLRRRK